MSEIYCPVDILAFGAHPDDVELGCAGTLLKAHAQGYRTAVVDLTRGEMASRGTAEERDVEATRAGELMGLTVRRNLDLGDGRLMDTQELRERIASEIRLFRPKIILSPFPGDRHPDHDAAGNAVQAAIFYARMTNRKLIDTESGKTLNAHSPDLLLIYPMHEMERPTIINEISEFHQLKMEVVRCYASQFLAPAPAEYKFIGTSDYIAMIEARGAYYGAMIQAAYGEPFIARSPLKVTDLLTGITGGKAGM